MYFKYAVLLFILHKNCSDCANSDCTYKGVWTGPPSLLSAKILSYFIGSLGIELQWTVEPLCN